MLTLKLSVLEFIRSCSRRAPGGRDFFWMTLLMFFVQLLAIIILSAREGVLERSVDAFLGNRPGYGIPVWTLPNFLGNSQPVMITNELVEEVRDAGFYGAPFRRLSNGELLRPSARDVWTVPQGANGGQFGGMAASFDGPFYPVIITGPVEGASPVPRTLENAWDIILDENLFRRFFDLEAYRTSLEGKLPQADLDLIPTRSADIPKMSIIWLNLKVHRREILTPFKISWSKFFGVGSRDTAFIVPIEMFNAYQVAKENPGLCAFLENGPAFDRRISSIRSGRVFSMTAEEKQGFVDDMERLGPLFGGELNQRGSRVVMNFDTAPNGLNNPDRGCDIGISSMRLSHALSQLDIILPNDRIEEVPTTAFFASGAETVTARCDALTERTLSKVERTGTGENCVATITVADTASGYSEMLMYAENRLAIKNLLDYLDCRRNPATPSARNSPNLCILPSPEEVNAALGGKPPPLPPPPRANGAGADRPPPAPRPEAAGARMPKPESRLMINQIYEDALTRFGFLTELLRAISGPIGAAMLFMLVAILWVQLGTVLGHRRIRYAMLLSNGLSWFQVKSLVVVQAAIGVCLSLIVALAVFFAAKSVVLYNMGGITRRFEMITLGNPIDVLPINVGMILIVFVATLITAVVLTLMQMRLNGLSPKSALERLLH